MILHGFHLRHLPSTYITLLHLIGTQSIYMYKGKSSVERKLSPICLRHEQAPSWFAHVEEETAECTRLACRLARVDVHFERSIDNEPFTPLYHQSSGPGSAGV